MIHQTPDSIIIENKFAKIEILSKNSAIKSIIDKTTNKELRSDDTYFFSVIGNDNTEIIPSFLKCKNDAITIFTSAGEFCIDVKCMDNYFTFELTSKLPENVYKLIIAHAKYNYDYINKENTGAVGISLTYWANPCFYPDAKDMETKAEVTRHLRDKGAKYALIIAPICNHCEIIKQASLTIDRNIGIVSDTGGAWGRDNPINFGNYTIQFDTSKEFIHNNLEFFKTVGADQIDFHKNSKLSFRQGDFKHAHYKNDAEFKANVSDVLEANGIGTGLHTYSFYIEYDCDTILSKPEYQKDLGVLETFTLLYDIDANDNFVRTTKDTENVESNYGFMTRNTPFILIDEEIIEFTNAHNGFKVKQRGACGTKATSHKKGAQIFHIDGYYHGIAPVPGSNLFFQIARNTAKTFNDGGFKMIYLDALDGIRMHCDAKNETWYYCAAFVCEILKHCDRAPMLEYSMICPSIWPARGRIGAYDPPFRSYKKWNSIHAENNKAFIDRFQAPTLGWYWFYPKTDRFPGNEHTKYHHTDAVEHMGSLAVMYNYGIAYFNLDLKSYESDIGLRRNIHIYKKYDDLRKAHYFSEDILEKIKNGKWEYHITEKENGDFAFIEKDYQIKKIYDLNDNSRNNPSFENPFEEQVPFIRIEAMMSTDNTNKTIVMKLDKEKEISEQVLNIKFDTELDLSQKLAKNVSVLGNGKKGSAIAIKLRCATNSEKGYAEYIIDTDFEGWRNFILLEADNGERPDLPFDNNEAFYAIYRSGFNNERVTEINIETAGDVRGVRMSDIAVTKHTYEVLKNPVVKLGCSSITFQCELRSTDFIEFDGKVAKVIDRFGNEKDIPYEGNIKVPNGKFRPTLSATALNKNTLRAQITFGFTGNEIN